MRHICFECDSDMIQARRVEPVDVRGERIDVEFEYLRCPNCGEEYEMQRPDYDPLAQAYRIYRTRKRLTPAGRDSQLSGRLTVIAARYERDSGDRRSDAEPIRERSAANRGDG